MDQLHRVSDKLSSVAPATLLPSPLLLNLTRIYVMVKEALETEHLDICPTLFLFNLDTETREAIQAEPGGTGFNEDSIVAVNISEQFGSKEGKKAVANMLRAVLHADKATCGIIVSAADMVIRELPKGVSSAEAEQMLKSFKVDEQPDKIDLIIFSLETVDRAASIFARLDLSNPEAPKLGPMEMPLSTELRGLLMSPDKIYYNQRKEKEDGK